MFKKGDKVRVSPQWWWDTFEQRKKEWELNGVVQGEVKTGIFPIYLVSVGALEWKVSSEFLVHGHAADQGADSSMLKKVMDSYANDPLIKRRDALLAQAFGFATAPESPKPPAFVLTDDNIIGKIIRIDADSSDRDGISNAEGLDFKVMYVSREDRSSGRYGRIGIQSVKTGQAGWVYPFPMGYQGTGEPVRYYDTPDSDIYSGWTIVR